MRNIPLVSCHGQIRQLDEKMGVQFCVGRDRCLWEREAIYGSFVRHGHFRADLRRQSNRKVSWSSANGTVDSRSGALPICVVASIDVVVWTSGLGKDGEVA